MILSPLPVQKFFSNLGLPLVGGKLFTYAAGTNTKIATYQNSSGTLNTNPIILNFRGECNVWLDPSLTYKFVLAQPFDTDPPTNPIWTVDNIAAGLTINELTQQFLGLILWPRTAAEIAASVTPTNYGFPPYHLWRYLPVNPDIIGGTDYSVQIQNWVRVLSQTGGNTGYAPAGIYAHALTINVNQNDDGFVIQGDSSGDYGDSAGTQPSRGSIFKYTGASTGWNIDSGAVTTNPKYLEIRNITFLGTSSADDGVVITRSTWCRFIRCVFAYYEQNPSSAVRLTIGSGTFTGGIKFEMCDWVGNYRACYVDSYPVNIVHFRECNFHSNVNGFQAGASTADVNFIRDLQFTGCDFEETENTDILINGGVALLYIAHNYFEQNDSSNNDPRIHLANTGTSPVSQGVEISNNDFSKLLHNAGEALVRIRSTLGLFCHSNWLIDTGNETDRYAIELVDGAVNQSFIVEAMLTVFGDAGYPNRISSANWFRTVEDYAISRVFRASGATLFYPSATDARADTGAQPYLNETLRDQSGAYTYALADRFATIRNGDNTGITRTIPTDASVAFPIGAILCDINDSSGSMTIAPAGGVTLIWNSGGGSGNRTIAARGLALLRKVAASRWMISGEGIT